MSSTVTTSSHTRLSSRRLANPARASDKDLHAAAQAEHQVERRLLLDVVVRQRAAVLELLAREDQALLVRRDALLVVDLLLDVLDGVARLDIQRNGVTRQRISLPYT